MTNSPALFGSDLGSDAPIADPLDLLDLWLGRVGSPAGAGKVLIDATTTPLMALATVDGDGDPCLRHVLLSAYDRGRLHFHTDLRSGKVRELRARPRAAVTIVWPQLPRQLVVSGPVTEESSEEQAWAYARRTPYLRRLAWANGEEEARRPEAERREAWRSAERRPVPAAPPATWVGYVLIAERINFWRGGPEAPSQRLVCAHTTGGWSVERRPG